MSKFKRSQALTFVIAEQYGNDVQELQVVGERNEDGQSSLTIHIMSDGWKLDCDEVDLFVESLADTLRQVVEALEHAGQQVSLP